MPGPSVWGLRLLKEGDDVRGDMGNKGGATIWAKEWVHAIVAAAIAVIVVLFAKAVGGSVVDALVITMAGAMAGYFTNDIAVTLLLSPQRPMFWGLLYGMFYKRKQEFGDSLIETAHERFLNADFMKRLAMDPTIRDALADGLRRMLDKMTSARIGTPRELFIRVTKNHSLFDDVLDTVADGVAKRLPVMVRENRDAVVAFSLRLSDEVMDVTLGELIDMKETNNLVNAAIRYFSSQDFKDVLDLVLEKVWSHLGTIDDSLGDFVPRDLRADMQRELESYIKDVVFRELERTLQDPEIRRRIALVVQEEVRRFIQEFKQNMRAGGWWGRVKAWFLDWFGGKDIEDAIRKVPGKVERVLESFLRDPRRKEIIENYVSKAIPRLMARVWGLRVASIVRWMPLERQKWMVDTVFGWLGRPKTQRAIGEKVFAFIENRKGNTVRSLLEAFFDVDEVHRFVRRVVGYAIASTRRPGTEKLFVEQAREMVLAFLKKASEKELPPIRDWGMSSAGWSRIVLYGNILWMIILRPPYPCGIWSLFII
jgi:uncharacterized membrane protein YheB (UPF0754 family)